MDMEQKDFCDYLSSYEGMSCMVKTYGYEEILEQAAALMQADPVDLAYYPVMDQAEERLRGLYQYALKDLQKHIRHYDRLYERLEGRASRIIFANLIGYRIVPVPSFLEQAYKISLENDFPGKGFFEEVTSFEKNKDWIEDGTYRIFLDVGKEISDLWVKPALLDKICPGYGLFLRYESFGESRRAVIYATPPKKTLDRIYEQMQKPPKHKRIIALAPYERGWSNAELVKDCGVIPYLLHKKYGYDVSMVGAPGSDYTNLSYIPGVKLEFLPDGTVKSKTEYIQKEAGNIDCLVLRGVYPDYIPVVDAYKKYNPIGKVFLPLDANSLYMDRIQWTDPNFQRFMGKCDVISAAGAAMQKHLNEKWPWVIERIPNGFYLFSGEDRAVDFGKKENIILTVGRLGTEQKATQVLLEAFAGIAVQIPDWKLHLAGSVEKSFEEYLNTFWERFPGLKERICFLGQITERDALYEEYFKSKIFALTSTWEGFPNVIPEALYAGNVIAMTKIDEYEEATWYGRCGMAAEIGDVAGFQEILLRLCRDSNLEEMSSCAGVYARERYDMERIVEKLHDLLFGEDV